MQHYYRIRDLREDNDLTQEALCKKLYMHKTTYTNYEQGKHTVPLDFAVTLADFYDVSLDYIAGRSNTLKAVDNSNISEDEKKAAFFKYCIRRKKRITLTIFLK